MQLIWEMCDHRQLKLPTFYYLNLWPDVCGCGCVCVCVFTWEDFGPCLYSLRQSELTWPLLCLTEGQLPKLVVSFPWLRTPRWHWTSDPTTKQILDRIDKSSFVKVEASAEITKCWCVHNIVSPSKTWQDLFGLIFLKWQEEMFSPKWLYPNEHLHGDLAWFVSAWGSDSPWRS